MPDYFLTQLLYNPWAGRNICVPQLSFRSPRRESLPGRSACPRAPAGVPRERKAFVVLWTLSTHWGLGSVLGAL